MPVPRLNITLDARPDQVFDEIERVLGVKRVRQRGDYWCWAACIATLTDFQPGTLGTLQPQAYVVLHSGLSVNENCVRDPRPGIQCDLPIRPEQMHGLWHLFVSNRIEKHRGRFRRVKEEILGRRPLNIVYERHTVMLDGWRQQRNGTTEVRILDPRDISVTWRGTSVLGFDPTDGDCLLTFFNLPKL